MTPYQEDFESNANEFDLLMGNSETKSLESILTGSAQTPRHIQELEKLQLAPAKQQAMLSLFKGSEPTPIAEVLGEKIQIRGAIIDSSGDYMSKSTGQLTAGYHTILLLTGKTTIQKMMGSSDTLATPIVLKCSGKRVAEWALLMMNSAGWFRWKKSDWVDVLFRKGNDGAFYVTPIVDFDEED